MVKSEKIDVHNKGSRTYTSPSGIPVASGQTVQLDREEGEAMMKGYPRELISPDDLRSTSSAQSNKDQHDLIVSQQAKIAELETGAVTDPKGVNRIAELESALKTALAINAELAQKYDELAKALEDAKKMATDAYAEVDQLKNGDEPSKAI
jgi:uncharacterized phage infection (PIP) family protein YhgE